jgi:hypothetical protein
MFLIVSLHAIELCQEFSPAGCLIRGQVFSRNAVDRRALLCRKPLTSRMDLCVVTHRNVHIDGRKRTTLTLGVRSFSHVLCLLHVLQHDTLRISNLSNAINDKKNCLTRLELTDYIAGAILCLNSSSSRSGGAISVM